MISSIASTLRWTLSLGSKFARVVPFSTLFIIFATLVSQILMLIASVLPLKVIVLVGSESIPSYFPSFLTAYSHGFLIGLLSFISIVFFLLYLLLERLITWQTWKGTTRLFKMSHKITLFEGQEKVGQDAYQRFSRSLASITFVLLSFIGLVLFYPRMLAILLAYIVFSILIIWFLFNTNKKFKFLLEITPAPTLNIFSLIGFFVAFAFLVIDFMFFSSPIPLIAIICLLLTRQIMNRLQGAISDVFVLQRNRVKIDALFFHGKVLMPEVISIDKGIWTFLKPQLRQQWVSKILDEFDLNPDNDNFTCRWEQVGATNIGSLIVEVDKKNFFLKLYELNTTAAARHEFTLLSEGFKNLPALKLIGTTEIQGHPCIIFELFEGSEPSRADYYEILWSFRIDLCSTLLSSSFVNHYQRSKPLLSQRLLALPLENLWVAVNDDDTKTFLEVFFSRLEDICDILEELPLALLNPNIGIDSLWISKEGKCVGMQWGLWTIDPVGSGIPETESEINKLKELWPKMIEKRDELSGMSLKHVELSALIFAFERNFNRQLFRESLALLPRIIKCIDNQDEGEANAE